MLTAYNEVRPKVIWNLPGTDAGNFEIQCVEKSRPRCSLWNDALAGAAPGRKTGTRLYKPQYWTLSPNLILQVHPATTHTGKRRNGHRPHEIFSAETADSLSQLRYGGYGRPDGATKFLRETTGTGPEFLFHIGARHFLQSCLSASPHQEMLLFNGGKCRVDAVHQMRQLAICPISITIFMGPLRHEVVIV